MAESIHPTPRRTRRLSVYWRWFTWLLAASAVLGLVIVLFFPGAAGIFLFGLYSIPTNSMIPAPHEPGLLFFAKFYHPVWIALAGTLGTAIAAFADYDLVGRAMRHPRIGRARDTRVYKAAVRWLMAWPFATIVVFAFTPLPIYVVRVLAPATGYPLHRYVIALMVGRFPRFLAVAYVGYVLPIPAWVLGLLFVLFLLPFVPTRLTRRASTGNREDDAEAEDDEDDTGLDLVSQIAGENGLAAVALEPVVALEPSPALGSDETL